MKKSAITHEPGTAEFVVAHGNWQISRGRNPSLSFNDILNPREAFNTAKRILDGGCGCGGDVVERIGCTSYYGSYRYFDDMSHEDMMRHGGLGFAVNRDVSEATMSFHLQANGLSYEQAEAVLQPSAA